MSEKSLDEIRDELADDLAKDHPVEFLSYIHSATIVGFESCRKIMEERLSIANEASMMSWRQVVGMKKQIEDKNTNVQELVDKIELLEIRELELVEIMNKGIMFAKEVKENYSFPPGELDDFMDATVKFFKSL